MLTVIVPTMWRYEPFIEFLSDIVKHPTVDEVIIVNNDEQRKPEADVLKHEKVKLISFKRNIYVNPAWNIGVLASKNEKICIMNDDIQFDLRLFDKALQHITPDLGVLGLSVPYCSDNITDGRIRIEPYIQTDNLNSFCLTFFVHRDTFDLIPRGLNIMFGDNFMFDNSTWKGRKIMCVKDLFYYTPQAATTSTIENLQSFYKSEAKIYKELVEQRGLDPYVWNPNLKTWIE